MTTITDAISTAQTRTLDMLAEGQETAVKAVDAWTEFLTHQAKAFMPASFEGRTFELPLFDQTVELPAFGALTEAMPRPTDLVDRTFSFAQDMLSKQRELATKLAASAEEMLPAADAS